MDLYFAPMEGITPYIFRNTNAEVFGGCDEYFAPFIVPSDNEKITRKTLRDIVKENNTVKIKPQVLCNSAKGFLKFVNKIKEIGYVEVNLNLGCPSGTVVKKNRGAGALKDTFALDKFLDSIFSATDIKISIKTRAGFDSHDEFERILSIYNQYSVKELIIHPRVREEYYGGTPNMQTFDMAYHNTNIKLCYNGDVYSKDDYEKNLSDYTDLNSVMIDRGAVKNPAIFREIKGGEALKTEELILFSKLLEERFMKLLCSEVYTLHRLKEMWIYAMQNFPLEKKIFKAVKKSNRLSDLNSAISCLPKL